MSTIVECATFTTTVLIGSLATAWEAESEDRLDPLEAEIKIEKATGLRDVSGSTCCSIF